MKDCNKIYKFSYFQELKFVIKMKFLFSGRMYFIIVRIYTVFKSLRKILFYQLINFLRKLKFERSVSMYRPPIINVKVSIYVVDNGFFSYQFLRNIFATFYLS